MKNRIFCLLLIAILIIGVYFGMTVFQFRKALNDMRPLDTEEVIKNVFAVNNKYVNFFLVKTGNDYIAVDAGADALLARTEMLKLKIAPEKVKAVMLTHSDRDHVAALPLFSKAKIYLSKDEEQMINGRKNRMLNMKNKLTSKYLTLSDGQIINISGRRILAILTPGHTPGSMSFLFDGGILFSGDTLGLKGGRVTTFNKFFNMDTETEKLSIKKLSTILGIKYIFTAHNGYSDKIIW